MADNWNNSPMRDTEKSNRNRWWVWLIAVVAVCFCLVCAGLVGLVAYFGREPQGLSLDYSIPTVVKLGDNFDFTLELTNTGSESITVNDIDVDELFDGSILEGSIVLETDPPMEKDYSLEGIKTFTYNQVIQPGETKKVIFHLQATTVGEFGGPVGVYVGDLSTRIEYVGITIQK